MEPLPHFRYHPDPVATGYLVRSEATCLCCEQARGYVYSGSPCAEDELESSLCPWCIFDGSAAERFDAEFVDPHELKKNNVEEAVIDEVTRRTPGFTAWQGDRWLCHCGDACEFHGDLPREQLRNVTADARSSILADLPRDFSWDRILKDYEPGGQPAIYWFRCRHCGVDLYYADCT